MEKYDINKKLLKTATRRDVELPRNVIRSIQNCGINGLRQYPPGFKPRMLLWLVHRSSREGLMDGNHDVARLLRYLRRDRPYYGPLVTSDFPCNPDFQTAGAGLLRVA